MKLEWRRMTETDLEMVMCWRMRPDITRFMNTDPQLTVDGQRAWFEGIRKREDVRYWIIYVDGESAGVINIANIDIANRRCEWGYYVAEKRVRSLQLAVALEYNLYEHVFNVIHMNRLSYEVLAFNKQVIKLHELCGSKIEGIMRQHVYKNGQYHDVVLFGMLAEDWHELQSTVHFEKATIEE